MGKIYSPEEVASGWIPEIGSHEQAARFIMDELIKPELINDIVLADGYVSTPYAESGMVYGSVAMGAANRRSDLDVLLNYHDNEAGLVLPRIASVLQSAEEQFKVHPEANIYPVGVLGDPRQHTIDALFAEHLIAIQAQDEPRWSYNWPVDSLIVSDYRVDFEDKDRIRAIALRYVSAKATQFARAIVGYRDKPDYRVLQRALELPTALGRKILAATYDYEIGDEVISGDRRRVREMLFERLEMIDWPGVSEHGIEPLARLEACNEDYTELLERAISGDVKIEEYAGWINERVPEAYLLAYRATGMWSEILSLNLDRKKYDEEMKQHPVTTADNEAY